jgi:S-adenosylmethionine:tRNA ribosyltransferase-isomerase
MLLSDFDFAIPKSLIAKYPLPDRQTSRLLVIPDLAVNVFENLADFVQPNDVLVLNNSKVIKSRIIIDEIEIFLHHQLDKNLWQAFSKPAKKVTLGSKFNIDEHKLIVKEKLDDGQVIVELISDMDAFSFLDKYGQMPLPPYIKRLADNTDDARYQTVFAKIKGSVAAPTAGLHFTKELIAQLLAKGIKICYITLHVGAGTFLPVKTEDIHQHKMHYENYSISQETADIINIAKQNNQKTIAVGTTTLRTLESSSSQGRVIAQNASTNLFVKPGFKFNVVDMLVTNFHLPKTTLLMLVAAFGGYGNIKKAYEFAVKNNFRFFSYGDANLIYRHDTI